MLKFFKSVFLSDYYVIARRRPRTSPNELIFRSEVVTAADANGARKAFESMVEGEGWTILSVSRR